MANQNKHSELNDGLILRSQIVATRLSVPPELDDLALLREALAKQDPALYTAPPRPDADSSPEHWTAWNLYMFRTMQAIRRGEVRHTRHLSQQGGMNKLIRGFYTDFFARLQGASSAPGVNQTLYIEKFAIGNTFAATSFSDTQLGGEIYRDTPDEFFDDTVSTFYASTFLKRSEANPTGNTTVSSSTTTIITVASATGFVLNGRIQVETVANTYNCTITNVSGTDLTVGNITGGSLSGAGAFDAGDIPQSGDTVKALHAEAACFIGGATTGTANTGNMMNRKLLEELKDSTVTMIYDYILACVSLD